MGIIDDISMGIMGVVMIVCVMGVMYLYFYEDIVNDDMEDGGEEEEEDIDLWPKE